MKVCKKPRNLNKGKRDVYLMVKKFEMQTGQQQKYRFKKAAKNAINAAINQSTVGSSTLHNAANTLGKAVKKAAERALPLSLRKRTIMIKILAMNSGISLQSPLAKTKKITININDRIIEVVKNFYTRDDISQQAPGKRDLLL